MLATRMLNRAVGPVMLQARVVNSEQFPDGQRMMPTNSSSPVCVLETPARARSGCAASQPTIRPGEDIRPRAMLMSPPAPAVPGGYDFQRQAYFEGFGAVGYSVGRATVLTPPADQPTGDEGLGVWFARLRFIVGERVRTPSHLRHTVAAVTMAPPTGEQRAIS
ncbi:MAG: hypothetical protein IPK78_16815 [Rhodospirillales bacterium]|nr:hypothetical protein [Rhodospirillales bacterium]